VVTAIHDGLASSAVAVLLLRGVVGRHRGSVVVDDVDAAVRQRMAASGRVPAVRAQGSRRREDAGSRHGRCAGTHLGAGDEDHAHESNESMTSNLETCMMLLVLFSGFSARWVCLLQST